MKLHYIVVRDENRPMRLGAMRSAGVERPERVDNLLVTRRGRDMAALGAAPPGPPPMISTVSHEVDGDEAEMISRDLAEDKKVVAHSLAMKLSPIEQVTVESADKRTAEEIEADNAAAMEADSNWGLAACGVREDGYDGRGTVVGIIDSGIFADHDAFAGKKICGRDFTGATDPKDVSDESGHGTHCAATIAGRAVAGRRVGVAPGVEKLLCARVFRRGVRTDADAVRKALDWCYDNGARVISLSLSFDFTGFAAELQEFFGIPPELATARVLTEFQNNLRVFDTINGRLAQYESSDRPGALLIAAAGNHSRRLGSAEGPPFSVPVAPPGNARHAIPVGALRKTADGLSIAAYSNTDSKLVAPGSGIVSADMARKDGLIAMSGTSMACPHVAGVAACWWQKAREDEDNDADIVRAAVLNRTSSDGICENVAKRDRGAGVPQCPVKA